jgi:hypothetical protein
MRSSVLVRVALLSRHRRHPDALSTRRKPAAAVPGNWSTNPPVNGKGRCSRLRHDGDGEQCGTRVDAQNVVPMTRRPSRPGLLRLARCSILLAMAYCSAMLKAEHRPWWPVLGGAVAIAAGSADQVKSHLDVLADQLDPDATGAVQQLLIPKGLPSLHFGEGAPGDLLGFPGRYAKHAQEGFGELIDGALVDLLRMLLAHAQQPE